MTFDYTLRKLSAYALLPALFLAVSGCGPDPRFEFGEGERVSLIGGALAERMQHDGWLETYLQAALPGTA